MQSLLLISILLLFANGFTFGQNAKLISASKYIEYYLQDIERNDIESLINAKNAIDLAIVHLKTKDKPKTWYYRGLIYKNIFEAEKMEIDAPDALNIAIEAYANYIRKDTKKRYLLTVIPEVKLLSYYSYNVGLKALDNQQFDDALSAFMQTLALNDLINDYSNTSKVDTVSLLGAGFSAYKAHKPDTAKEMFTKLIEHKCKSATIYQSLANIYKSESDTIKAMEVLQLGRQLNPNNRTLIIDELNIHLAAKEIDKVVVKLESAVELDSANADLYFALGTAYNKLNKVSKADNVYRKALNIKPDYFEVLYNIGALYYNQAMEIDENMNLLTKKEQKKYDSIKIKRDELLKFALPFFEKAYNINNLDNNTRLTLQEIYARLGEFEKLKSFK